MKKNILTIIVILGFSHCGGNSDETTIDSRLGGNNGSTAPITTTPAAFQYEYDITGINGITPEFITPDIDTDSILHVRVIPGLTNASSLPNFPFSTQANCVALRVDISLDGGLTWTAPTQTPTMKVGGTQGEHCPNSSTSTQIDFSGFTGANQPVKVRVSNGRYDFYCQLWYEIYDQNFALFTATGIPQAQAQVLATQQSDAQIGFLNTVCPLKPVFGTHNVTGTLQIGVNGSRLF